MTGLVCYLNKTWIIEPALVSSLDWTT